MSQTHNLTAYLATLAAIVLLVVVAVVASIYGAKLEAVGVGGAVTGLIGVAGTFRPRSQQQEAGQ